MPTLISIDRSTLRRNPDAGRTTYIVPLPRDIEATYSGPEGQFRFLPVGDVEPAGDSFHGRFICTQCLPMAAPPKYLPGEEYDIAPTSLRHWNLKVNQPVQIVETAIPAPSWLYEYDYGGVRLTCPECGEEFACSDLKTVDIETEDYSGSIETCPRCGEEIQLEFEEPGAVAKELGIA